jgi:hypothetical protein
MLLFNDLFGEKSERNAQVKGNIETKQLRGTKMRKRVYLNVILIILRSQKEDL